MGKESKGMILVSREVGSKELLPLIQKIGVKCELTGLPYGDFAFDGNGPGGPISIGVERKTLHYMLHCIDDSRYSSHQLPGMRSLYSASYLILEGVWKAHEQGFLMEGYPNGTYGHCKYRGRPVMYSKLRRYLFSVGAAGVNILYSRDMFQTAYDICELYHYYQKRWEDHTSLIGTQELAIPSLLHKPSLLREWAARLPGVGVKLSMEAERVFSSAGKMAASEENAWLRIPGVGVKTARQIVREIWK